METIERHRYVARSVGIWDIVRTVTIYAFQTWLLVEYGEYILKILSGDYEFDEIEQGISGWVWGILVFNTVYKAALILVDVLLIKATAPNADLVSSLKRVKFWCWFYVCYVVTNSLFSGLLLVIYQVIWLCRVKRYIKVVKAVQENQSRLKNIPL